MNKEYIKKVINCAIDGMDDFELRKSYIEEAIKALDEIHAVLQNAGVNDFECIEQIVLIMEEIGYNCGYRHDF